MSPLAAANATLPRALGRHICQGGTVKHCIFAASYLVLWFSSVENLLRFNVVYFQVLILCRQTYGKRANSRNSHAQFRESSQIVKIMNIRCMQNIGDLQYIISAECTRVGTLQRAGTCPPQKRPFMWGIWTPGLVAWLSGRTSVFGRRTFSVLRSTCSWRVTTYVGKPSAIGQPTRPTQPFIPSGSIDE